MKIQLMFDGRVIPATLVDTPAAHDFVAMLPITLTLHALFGRERIGALPEAVGPAEPRSQACAVGDIVCWSAGPDLGIVHAHDSRPLCGRFHVLGRIDAGVEAFAVPGPLDVRIARAARDDAPLPGGACAGYRGRKPSSCAASAS